jgi:hypothetical protein
MKGKRRQKSLNISNKNLLTNLRIFTATQNHLKQGDLEKSLDPTGRAGKDGVYVTGSIT